MHHIPTSRCPKCGGEGIIYHKFNIVTREEAPCTYREYMSLPMDEDDAEFLKMEWCCGDALPCETCDGVGSIPDSSPTWAGLYADGPDHQRELEMCL